MDGGYEPDTPSPLPSRGNGIPHRHTETLDAVHSLVDRLPHCGDLAVLVPDPELLLLNHRRFRADFARRFPEAGLHACRSASHAIHSALRGASTRRCTRVVVAAPDVAGEDGGDTRATALLVADPSSLTDASPRRVFEVVGTVARRSSEPAATLARKVSRELLARCDIPAETLGHVQLDNLGGQDRTTCSIRNLRTLLARLEAKRAGFGMQVTFGDRSGARAIMVRRHCARSPDRGPADGHSGVLVVPGM